MRLSTSSSNLSSRGELASESSVPQRGMERTIPAVPWVRTLFTVAAITFVLLLGWEAEMRHLGLRAGDLDDGRDYWSVERRKVDSGPRDAMVLIGDSRMLFDTDLSIWQKLTGRRPIQLAVMGANARPMLHDLANDEHFAGLLVVGTAEFSYFDDNPGESAVVMDYIKEESPSQRVGHQIYKFASRYLAFPDSNYTMFTLFERRRWPERPNVGGPYMDVWKVGEFYDHRQGYFWEELERNPDLLAHTRMMWTTIFAGDPVTADLTNQVIETTKADIDRIRARGGEVVWLRPPSAGPILDIERTRYPRAKVWDRLLHDTGSFGMYFEDYPSMQHLPTPDWSHLSKSSTLVFTNAYVGALLKQVPWLKTHKASWDAGHVSSH